MIRIRALVKADYPRVKEIHQQGLDGGDAAFLTEAKDWQEWDQQRAKTGRLVALIEDEIVAWACLNDVSSNCYYDGVGETSIYVSSAHQGKGVGLALLNTLVEAAEQAGYWTLQALVFPENIASIHIHQQAGFKVLGTHKKLGKRYGVWRDVVRLERRSSVAGQD